MQEKTNGRLHEIYIQGRSSMTVSGVTDVEGFDENEITLYTCLGELTIQGRELHIDTISTENGDMSVSGDIWAVLYGDRDRKGPLSWLGRLFR